MTDPLDDDARLRRLLSDAVSDIEPDNRLDELRASVHPNPKVVPMARSRSWYAATGIVATAAVIGVVAYVASMAIDKNTSVGPATDPHATLHSSVATATDTAASRSPSPSVSATKAYAVYYAGTDPRGEPVLYREFHRGPASTPAGVLPLDDLQATPLDPDYTTAWQAGWLKDAKANPNAGVIFVTPSRAVPARRPAGMTADQARIAIQQVVYTLQGAFATRMPVLFVRHGTPVPRVLGVSTSEPVEQGKVLETCSRVNISDPNEGDAVSGKLVVRGVNNAFEGTVVVYLERNGKKYLLQPTIGGMGGNRLWPWTVTLDTSKVSPGSYTLVARNDDPSGRGRFETDTRVITVK
ncbi:MAG TPA: Gmad2 immunoglobulin-like domain-containing protein [Nocardioides sp.]|uniref:Gmad2 immunoglobulin-like domain-containing protein n=1 Tax=Nocardioides sp. TaxID=35761 RepID=UPI002F3EEBF1